MVVHAAGRHEDRVPQPGPEGVEQGGDVFARRRRVGDVVHGVEPLPGERPRQRRVLRAVGDDRPHAGGDALGPTAAVEDGDLVALPLEAADEVQADELGAADDENAHRAAS